MYDHRNTDQVCGLHYIVTSMVLCGLGMQQYAMHNATIQKTTVFELGEYRVDIMTQFGGEEILRYAR